MMEDEPPSKRPRVSSVTLPDPPSMEKVGVESTKAVASSQAQDDEHLPTRVSDEPDIKREAYYSANFKVVLKTVLSDSPEHHVVSEYGMRMVDEFMSLSEPQQQLYVRLFLRKHDWLREEKLVYKDITSDLTPVIHSLVDKGFLLDASKLADPTEVLTMLQLSELKGLCRQLNMPTSVVGSQKSSIIQALFKHDRQQKPLFGQAQFMKIVVSKARKILGGCVKVAEEPREVFSKLMLLFSLTDSWVGGDEDTSFSQIIYKMLQVNVGTLVYPEYKVDVSHPLFRSTEHFEEYYLATKFEQSVVQAIEGGDDDSVRRLLSTAVSTFKSEQELASKEQRQIECPFLRPFTSGWTYTRVISQISEYLEKKKRHEEANGLLELLLSQRYFCPGSRGRWADRLALNYDFHLKKKNKCLDVIITALKDPLIHDSKRLSLLQRARKICLSQDNVPKKRKSSIDKSRKSSASSIAVDTILKYRMEDFPMMDIVEAPEVHITGHRLKTAPVYLTSTSLQRSLSHESDSASSEESTSTSSSSTGRHSHSLQGVEGYAISYYTGEIGWPCALHAEGSCFTTLFALLMWEVIFAPGISDVFRSKFQNGPLDLHSSTFYENRQQLIDERLAMISQANDEEISTLIKDSWDKHYGQLCVGLNWELFPSKQDAKNFSECMGGHLLSCVCEVFCKDYRHSVGGLPDLVLWNPATKTCKFVEVKGPGDRLSHKQIVWLSRLAKWSCDVEVCRVTAKRKLA